MNMEPGDVISKYVSELKDKYRLLASKVQEVLSSILSSNRIITHSITSRVKEQDSLKEKINRIKINYDDPLSVITDLAGARVITYFPSDVDKICDVIEKEFRIDRGNSIDKRKTSDPSIFGYASVHLVVEFALRESSFQSTKFLKI